MKRRDFLAAFGGATALACWPGAARGQARPLIVWLGSGTTAAVGTWVGYLRKGLEALGYLDGREFELQIRMAENQAARLPGLAEEIVALKPAVIVAGAVDAAVAARKVTTSIPIISGALADADHLGLIASYARPGGNVTGITPYVAGLPAKQMELAHELVSGVTRIGVLGNMSDPKAPPQRDELSDAGRKLGLTVVTRDLIAADGLAEAIEALKAESVGAVIVLQTSMLLSLRKQIAPVLAAKQLPAIYGYRQHVDEGGLVSYGVNLAWCWQHLATYVHKILNGASPADLPVEFPSRLQMVVNLKAATSLGISIPPVLLARADEVIE